MMRDGTRAPVSLSVLTFSLLCTWLACGLRVQGARQGQGRVTKDHSVRAVGAAARSLLARRGISCARITSHGRVLAVVFLKIECSAPPGSLAVVTRAALRGGFGLQCINRLPLPFEAGKSSSAARTAGAPSRPRLRRESSTIERRTSSGSLRARARGGVWTYVAITTSTRARSGMGCWRYWRCARGTHTCVFICNNSTRRDASTMA